MVDFTIMLLFQNLFINVKNKNMKTKIFKLTVVLLILAGSFSSCGKRSENNFTDPMDIPFTEYSLKGTSCQWLIFDMNKCRTCGESEAVKNCFLTHRNELIVINRDSELEEYLECTDGSYPAIDFSKHTLLLAKGYTFSGISEIAKSLQQLSANEYRLNVDITLNDATYAEGWNIALLISKLSEESTVELNLTNDREEPLSLKGTEWKLTGIVDKQTGVLKEIVPSKLLYNSTYYTLTFYSDVEAYWVSDGRSVFILANNPFILVGPNPPFFDIDEEGNIMISEYFNALRTARAYIFTKKELKIFVNQNSSYLFYKPIDQ